MTAKICRKCGVEKPIEDFYRQKTSSDGRGSYCKICNKGEVSKYVKREPEKSRQSWTKGKLKHRTGIVLTDSEWDELLAKKAGGCEICGSHKRLSIDHCHARNVVRGILCHTCNVGLGMFHDDPAKMLKAIKYLE